MKQTASLLEYSNAENLAKLLQDRRTIDLFEPDPVGEQVLLDGIESARWAPNHRLTEPWRFYVIGHVMKESIARCAADFEAEAKGERVGQARYKRLMDIPAFFVVTSRVGTDELTDREDYAATCCAVQNLSLYLWRRGVGVKWTTGAITREARFYDLLRIDSTVETIIGFFWYGVARIVPEPMPRKSVAEIVQHL